MQRGHPALEEVEMKRISQAVVAAVGLALAGSAFARYQADPYYYDTARVVRVDRIIAADTQPVTREDCWREPAPGTSDHEIIPGGVVESTHVSGDGVVRSDVIRTNQIVDTGADLKNVEQEKCRVHTDYAQTSQVLGYDVVYNYHNEDYHDRMSRDPGVQVRVRVQDGYVQIVE
jgi:uncharacterized protein YcfJ